MADPLPPKSTTATTITTTPLPPPNTHPIPPIFAPGPKLSADGRTVFHKDPVREEFDRKWRERVARGEDPMKALSEKIDATGSSSFVEIWWRKARGKEKTRLQEREAKERREAERVEGGRAGLLEREGKGDKEEDGEVERVESGGKGEGKGKWHDRLRWGI